MQDMQTIFKTVLVILVLLVPVAALASLATVLLMRPLRRVEQAMLFLDVFKNGLQRGLTPEQVIVSAAGMQERALGPRFYLLAALLDEQVPLAEAIRQSRVLPPFGRELLAAGVRDGGGLSATVEAIQASTSRLVEASRRRLRGPALMFSLLLPMMVAASVTLRSAIIPKLRQMSADMEVDALVIESVFSQMWFATFALIAVPLAMWLLTFVRLSSAAPGALGASRFARMTDWLFFRLPWRRMRMREDFSRSLALLLDAGLPEAQAVRLAGRCAGNATFERLTREAEKLLGEGVTLAEAVKHVDASPEFGWRLRQGGWGPGAFQTALRGWVEALCIRASVKEEWVAQISSIALMLANGLLVALLVSSVFAFFSAVISEAATW